jgi:hypothetical protein
MKAQVLAVYVLADLDTDGGGGGVGDTGAVVGGGGGGCGSAGGGGGGGTDKLFNEPAASPSEDFNTADQSAPSFGGDQPRVRQSQPKYTTLPFPNGAVHTPAYLVEIGRECW